MTVRGKVEARSLHTLDWLHALAQLYVYSEYWLIRFVSAFSLFSVHLSRPLRHVVLLTRRSVLCCDISRITHYDISHFRINGRFRILVEALDGLITAARRWSIGFYHLSLLPPTYFHASGKGAISNRVECFSVPCSLVYIKNPISNSFLSLCLPIYRRCTLCNPLTPPPPHPPLHNAHSYARARTHVHAYVEHLTWLGFYVFLMPENKISRSSIYPWSSRVYWTRRWEMKVPACVLIARGRDRSRPPFKAWFGPEAYACNL